MIATLALAGALFFDDFSQADRQALVQSGWTLRDKVGHPGIVGARWDAEHIELVADPQQPNNRLVRLHAATDGTPEGSYQTQLCRAPQTLWGTTSARIRFSDQPHTGADGDAVIQAFFQVSPLRFDYDPLFSELDWEYLPNGGWGAPETRLYGIAWQTVRLEPWDAHNLSTEVKRSFADRWTQLTVQSTPQGSRWFVDGRQVAWHAGRTVPRQAMSLAFSHWFSPSGLLPVSAGAQRHYSFDVDWVLHLPDQSMSPQAMHQRVQALRRAGVAQQDSLPTTEQPARCDF